MNHRAESITPALLRGWPLPSPSGSKYARGQVLVVGGATGSPGAVMLAGLAALRVGAGRLTLAVAEGVAHAVAVAVPESGVIALPQTPKGSVRGAAATELVAAAGSADAIVVGPGLDDVDETQALLDGLKPVLAEDAGVVLDAYALGALPRVGGSFASSLVLTPNHREAETLLDRPIDDVTADVVAEIADGYAATTNCGDWVATVPGRIWRDSTGHPGLATSGSGDVLAGTVAGLLARGAQPDQAACWGSHLHSASGDRLAAEVGSLGFLARELVEMLPRVLAELAQS
jgi:hydroxyethylthiazole kinase-like uncharacterized protein yjeF